MGIYVKSASPTYNHQEVPFPATTSKIKQMFKIPGEKKKKREKVTFSLLGLKRYHSMKEIL